MDNSYLTQRDFNDIVRGILNVLGLPFTEEPARDSYLWTGTQFRIGKMTASSILHEVAHWLVATEDERKTPEFGLGLAPEPGCLYIKTEMTKEQASLKETLSSVLGIQMERALEMDWAQTHHEHGWGDTNQSFEERIQTLKSLGLLNPDESPSFLKTQEGCVWILKDSVWLLWSKVDGSFKGRFKG